MEEKISRITFISVLFKYNYLNLDSGISINSSSIKNWIALNTFDNVQGTVRKKKRCDWNCV